MHFNPVKPFDGAVAVETGPTEVLHPSSTQVGSDAGVTVLEDGIFP